MVLCSLKLYEGGTNKYYEYPTDRRRTALNILDIENTLSNLSLSPYTSLKAKDLLKNKDLANALSQLVQRFQARIPEFMQKFALSGQDKVKYTTRFIPCQEMNL